MKLIKKVLPLLMLVGISVSSNSLADTVSAVDLANACAGCHGTDGNSIGPATPKLAGISSEYFVEAMLDFQSKEGRFSTIMSRIAKGYTEIEIDLMADHFSKQKINHRSQVFDPQKAKAGAKIHKKYCEKCHEDGGRSADDDAGILAGQMMKYLEFTLSDFRNGKREMTKKMSKKVKKLDKDKGNKAFDNLIHFYGSQK